MKHPRSHIYVIWACQIIPYQSPKHPEKNKKNSDFPTLTKFSFGLIGWLRCRQKVHVVLIVSASHMFKRHLLFLWKMLNLQHQHNNPSCEELLWWYCVWIKSPFLYIGYMKFSTNRFIKIFCPNIIFINFTHIWIILNTNKFFKLR
jgi:hypothetical protein